MKPLVRLSLAMMLLPVFCFADQPVATQPAGPRAPEEENAALAARVAELETQVRRLKEENRRLMVLAGITPPADAAEAQKAKVITRTDPDTGVTTLSFKFERLEVTAGSRDQHWMRLSCRQPPQAAGPPTVSLTILARLTHRLYRDVDVAHLSIDGESLSLPITRNQQQMRGGALPGGRGRWDEELTLDVPLEVVRRLASAGEAEMRLRNVRLVLGPHQIGQFAAFEQRLGQEMSSRPSGGGAGASEVSAATQR